MPGTHRTPPDADGWNVAAHDTPHGAILFAVEAPDGRATYADVSPGNLPALVAALAAHLTVDARRALTRDLAARDGNAVVDAWDARACADFFADPEWSPPTAAMSLRLRAAVDAARGATTGTEGRA